MAARSKNGNPGDRFGRKKGATERAEGQMTGSQVIKAFKTGQRHAVAGEWSDAVKHLLVAWEGEPNDYAILTLLAHSLVQLGVREKAISVLEAVLARHGATPDVCAIMLQMSVEMELWEIAIKVGNILVTLAPDEPAHFVNLTSAYIGSKRFDDAVEVAQLVLPRFPEYSDLWNNLATAVQLRDGVGAADVFFEEALRLDPNNFKALSNYSMSMGERLQFDKALELDYRAMKANPNSPEPRLGAAYILFHQGRMAEAWDYYEYRHDARRTLRQSQIYTHDLPRWDGESLKGKTLLVAAEQGIGDEIMFGNYLPFLYEQAEKLVIGCDRRLISIYQRRFPDAVVGAYQDAIYHGYRYRSFPVIEQAMKEGTLKIDCAVPLASGPRYAWSTVEEIKPHPEGFLTADPDLMASFKDRMKVDGKRPRIGLCWRSGNVEGLRANLYAGIQDLAPLFALKDHVDFVNLQYGDCTAELAEAKERFGVDILNFDDVNLKADIEANLAIMAHCDLMVSAASAPGMFALSLGRPTLLMSKTPPWWNFGCTDHVPFARDVWFPDWDPEHSWADIVGKVAHQAAARLGISK